MNLETIEGLLQAFDDAIDKREKDLLMIDRQYVDNNGNVISSQYDEYRKRKQAVIERFNKKAIEYQKSLDKLCHTVRQKQPVLIELNKSHINTKGRFPRRIALGKCHVNCENIDFYVPKMFMFPFSKPMYICEDNQMHLIHKVILRLMYSLPADKQEYYVFDPMGLGKSVWNFNRLFSNGKVFPQKKVMSNSAELKEALKDVMEYMQSLYAGTFNMQSDCNNWDSYNRFLYSQNKAKKMLPYKVFLFFNVPDGMDAECFDMFRKLLLHCEECGFLVLFSFNEVILEAEDSKMKAQELMLKQCIENSLPLHAVLDKTISDVTFKKLNVTSVGEKFPTDEKLVELLSDFDEVIKQNKNSMFSFDDMLQLSDLFSQKSCEGLSIPSGYSSSGGLETIIEINDRYTHYLIGGTTGSGKSNLLHNLITSACWNYSPEQLQVYLLDFKEGVEFSRYAKDLLPHASLIATEADTEYGVSVLDHLIEIQSERYNLFKGNDCNKISEFLSKNPTEVMPRLLVFIDEFQVLFEGRQKDRTIEKLTTLAKLGRACGIHLILATQSLKGIDFGTIGSQFSGRIALKCSAEDSKQLLGGITSNNEEASELEIPYAILNVSQGSKSGNVKFAVPEAKSELIEQKLKIMIAEAQKNRIITKTKIFKGQSFPVTHDLSIFKKDNVIDLTLGEALTYKSESVNITFDHRPENNVLICGHDLQMKRYFLIELLLSADGCTECDELIYIGDPIPELFSEFKSKKLITLSCLTDFIKNYKEHYFDKKRIVIIDSVDMTREIGFPPPSYGQKNDLAVEFKIFWDDANKHNNHIIAFYDGMTRVKACGIPIQDFKYRIGYSLNGDEKNQLLGNTAYSNSAPERQRAFLANNLIIETWFRPYMF